MGIKEYFEENLGRILTTIVILIMILSVVGMNKSSRGSNCFIKGNISYNDGEKIYHMPGQEYYDATVPEACFDSEYEAREAGYIKSYR